MMKVSEHTRCKNCGHVEYAHKGDCVACGCVKFEPRKPKEPTDALTDFLGSRQGKTLQREVIRGAFSLLRKRL